ncbi:hypothetical protein BDN72DRAFT_906417 [Pluteus cervinus]|uniref:Uncharacterized protein n=1 Tax=Pluteus cervinus TaxID=181527 RepID=A0ACD2ZZQ4_9AGAR|nr:hypothetical protein BDN72DRAFT_906417 [Pluteus cervinus]
MTDDNAELLPYIVGDGPADLGAGDEDNENSTQDELLRHLYDEPAPHTTSEEKFLAIPTKSISLGMLRSIHDNKLRKEALNLLSQRHRIELDRSVVWPTTHPKLNWGTPAHFLDFRMLVSEFIGLDAFLPKDVNHTWSITLQFNLSHISWRMKHGNLGFDPTRRMMAIGRVNQDHAWIAFAPRAYIHNGTDGGDSDRHGPTNVEEIHHRRFLAFLCWILSELGIQHFVNFSKYPDVSSRGSLASTSTIYDLSSVELAYAPAQDVSTMMYDKYHGYFQNSPASWQEDGFFAGHIPLSVSARYGQNQDIVLQQGQFTLQQENWELEHDYSQIRSMSFALASDIQCNEIVDTEWFDDDEITRDYPRIYDTSDPDTRQRVLDLSQFPRTHPDGRVRQIYDEHGAAISRCDLVISEPPLGLLLKLDNLHELFTRTLESSWDEDDDEAIPQQNSAKVHVYPQAFLKHAGHFQADSILSGFDTLVASINERIGLENPNSSIPLTGSSCQGYNEVMHRLRPRASLHDVQLGRVTSALAGTYSTTAPHRTTATRHLNQCKNRLPHVASSAKLDTPTLNRNLRIEQTFHLNLLGSKPTSRSGRAIFTEVIHPLVGGMNSREVARALMEHIVVFRQGIYPDLYRWVMYPPSVGLEIVFEASCEMADDGHKVKPYYVELASCLERTINFSQTGSASAIRLSLMDGLGLGHGLRVDGMPVLFKIVTFPAEKTIKIQSNLWPVSERTKKPFLASRRSHLLNYSESHYKVYETLFCIEHAILNPPADLYQRITNPQLRFAHIAIYVGLKFFRDELVDWVEEAILQELAPLLTSPAVHIEQAALARQTHLGNWKSSETPFASTNPSLSHLILALATEDDDITAGLPRQRQISVADFSDLILTNVLNHPPSPRPPFPHHGSSHLVMHHALAVANRYWKNANGVKSILMRILPHLHINFVPGQRQVNHRPRLSCEAWINLGAPVLASDIISPTLLTQSQTEVVEASAAARDYIAQDINSTYELGSLKWAEVGRLLDKNSLPSEWDASSGDTQGGYVRETYDFVQEVFSGTDAIHKLAVIAAFISIKMIPRMFSECSKATIKALPTDPTAITNFMRALPWVTLEGRRGVRVPEPFISGVLWAVHGLTNMVRQRLRHCISPGN